MTYLCHIYSGIYKKATRNDKSVWQHYSKQDL
jgi:hypothetical protein